MDALVFPTNFSKNTRKVIISFLKEFVKHDYAKNTDIVLIHAYETPHFGQSVLHNMEDRLEENALEDLQREVRLIEEAVPMPDSIKILHYTYRGSITSVLHRFDKEKEIGMVIMALKSSNVFSNLLENSSPATLVNSISEPVLFIPDSYTFKDVNKIVFAVDLEPFDNQREFRKFVELATVFNSCVDFVYVAQDYNDTAQDRFNEIYKPLIDDTPLTYAFHNLIGNSPKEAISKYSRENHIDLLAIITRKKTFFSKLFEASMANELANIKELPLLILSEKEDNN